MEVGWLVVLFNGRNPSRDDYQCRNRSESVRTIFPLTVDVLFSTIQPTTDLFPVSANMLSINNWTRFVNFCPRFFALAYRFRGFSPLFLPVCVVGCFHYACCSSSFRQWPVKKLFSKKNHHRTTIFRSPPNSWLLCARWLARRFALPEGKKSSKKSTCNLVE